MATLETGCLSLLRLIDPLVFLDIDEKYSVVGWRNKSGILQLFATTRQWEIVAKLYINPALLYYFIQWNIADH
jgi:hypothetical protein